MPTTSDTTNKPRATKPASKVKTGAVVYVDQTRIKYARTTRKDERGILLIHFWDGSGITLEENDTLVSSTLSLFAIATQPKGGPR